MWLRRCYGWYCHYLCFPFNSQDFRRLSSKDKEYNALLFVSGTPNDSLVKAQLNFSRSFTENKSPITVTFTFFLRGLTFKLSIFTFQKNFSIGPRNCSKFFWISSKYEILQKLRSVPSSCCFWCNLRSNSPSENWSRNSWNLSVDVFCESAKTPKKQTLRKYSFKFSSSHRYTALNSDRVAPLQQFCCILGWRTSSKASNWGSVSPKTFSTYSRGTVSNSRTARDDKQAGRPSTYQTIH